MSNFIQFSNYETETEEQKATIEGMRKTQEWCKRHHSLTWLFINPFF